MAETADVVRVVNEKEDTILLNMADLCCYDLTDLEISPSYALRVLALNDRGLQAQLGVAHIFLVRDDLSGDELVNLECGLPLFDVCIGELADTDVRINLGAKANVKTVVRNLSDETAYNLANLEIGPVGDHGVLDGQGGAEDLRGPS